jgi:hypothetical protein
LLLLLAHGSAGKHMRDYSSAMNPRKVGGGQ